MKLWREARCDRIRAGAALVRELVAEQEKTYHRMIAGRCYALANEASTRSRDLEQLCGLLMELASEQLLG